MAMSALELRWQLRRQQRKFQIVPQPVILPLTPPTSGPMILEGVAATCTLDCDRMRLVPGALDPLPRRVPLWLHHDPTVIAGIVETLDYDINGILRVRARVEHPQARRLPAFSVGLRIIQCELVDADTPDFHGVLHRAELVEVTVTDRPSNLDALVSNRIPAAVGDVYTHTAAAMRCASRILSLMQETAHAR
jgi:hypothetical protein